MVVVRQIQKKKSVLTLDEWIFRPSEFDENGQGLRQNFRRPKLVSEQVGQSPGEVAHQRAIEIWKR